MSGLAARSILGRRLRIFQFAMDERAIDANPVHRVPPLKRRMDPEQVFGEAKRRALTPEEAGRFLACFPMFWWDHMVTLLGTGLRFGELAGLRRRRVHLNRPLPVLEVGPTRYQAGRFGSGFKPRPKSDAGIRPVPLAPLVVEAIRRQLPPGNDPEDLVFTGPGEALAAPAGRAYPEAPGPSCPGTTCTAPTRAPWPSWPTRPSHFDQPPDACCGPYATAAPNASSSWLLG
jgi:integrase